MPWAELEVILQSMRQILHSSMIKSANFPSLLLAKRMMVTIKCNLTFSMTLNFIAIILAITGILNPVIGALVHNAGSVLVNHKFCIFVKLEEKKKMIVAIIAVLIGLLLIGAGGYYFI